MKGETLILHGRHDAEHPYTCISNAVMTDRGLTPAEFRVLVYILSKPKDWRVWAGEVARSTGLGRNTVLRAIKRLEQRGYAERHRFRHQDGRFEWVLVVREEPGTEMVTGSEQGRRTKAEVATSDQKPSMVNGSLPSTDPPSTEVGFPPSTDESIHQPLSVGDRDWRDEVMRRYFSGLYDEPNRPNHPSPATSPTKANSAEKESTDAP